MRKPISEPPSPHSAGSKPSIAAAESRTSAGKSVSSVVTIPSPTVISNRLQKSVKYALGAISKVDTISFPT